jgi:hypothetical protein
MTNDRFDDALRRKLEEVKPAYQDKNWTQLQRFMGSRGFPPSVWHSPVQWLQPALTAAAATALVLTSVWQYRNTQALNERIETLTKTVSRLEQTQTTLQQTVTDHAAAAPPRPDTVYVVQRVPVWVQPATAPNVPAQRTQPDRQLAESLATPAESPPTLAAEHRRTRPTQPTTKSNLTQLNETPVYETPTYPTNTRRPTTVNTPNKPTERTRPANGVATTNVPTERTRLGAGQAANVPADEQRVAADNQSVATDIDALVTARSIAPITYLSQPDNWADRWQQRLKRVRYRLPLAAAAPATPEKSSRPTDIRWRLGIGGDVGTVQLGAGVYAEALINNHLIISAGVGQAVWLGDAFQTDAQFGQQFKRDFKKEYPGGMANVPGGPSPFPQSRAVLDISRTGRALMVPVQMGYRFETGKGFFLTPFVGANLSFNTTEEVNYALALPYARDFDWQNLRVNRPFNLYSSWVLGFGGERKLGPFIAQLSPLVTIPFTNREAGLNDASVGLRARVSYQF